MNKNISIHDKYHPALKITAQPEADGYFQECVEHCMSHGKEQAEAQRIERINLAFYAAYAPLLESDETRARVEKLFACAHPIFGAIAEHGSVTVGDALEVGRRVEARENAERAIKAMNEGTLEAFIHFLITRGKPDVKNIKIVPPATDEANSAG